MSSADALPISSARFAAALQELPVENLHSTAAEIHNSLSHLESSNAQMKPFADDGDQVCLDAISENQTVMQRMYARIDLLKAEVERRGMPWPEELASTGSAVDARPQPNGHALPSEIAASAASRTQNGSLSDEELRRRVEAQMREMQGDDDDEGVHL